MCVCVCVCEVSFSHVQLFATLWAVAHQARMSVRFSRQEYWIELPFLPGDRPDSEIEPTFLLHLLHWQVGSLPLVPLGKPIYVYIYIHIYI